MHIEVLPNFSVGEARQIAHQVEKKIENMEEVETALVHVCPAGARIGKGE